MGYLRLAGAIVLSGLVVATSISPSRANDDPNHHVILDSFAEGVSGTSEIYALPDDQIRSVISGSANNYLSQRKLCETLDSQECSGKTGLSLRIYLPPCSNTTNNMCIEGLQVSQNSNAPLVQGNFLSLTDGRTYPANPSKGTPEASAPSQWQVPNVLNSGGSDKYVVKVLLDAFKLSTDNSLNIFDLNALVDGDSKLLPDQRVALTLHLPNTLTGWLNGRLTNSSIDVSKIDDSINRLRVEANPVTVPEVDVTLTPSQVNALPNPHFFQTGGSQWVSVNAGNPAALEWIKQLSGVMNNTSTGEHTSWFFSTIGGRQSNPCLADKTKVVGLVTTNSAVYSPGAPEFVNGFLDYQVGGLHFKADGKTLNQGTYDLLIRSDVARCLYNYTKAPISATVSVASENGDNQVGTTIVTEKDGWLHLGAYGFTYSSPIVRVKLKGTLASQASKSNQQSNQQSSSQGKVSGYPVTCVKGKVVQKIIAAKPMCPAGWTKK